MICILEYPVGWPVLFMQLAQDFMIGWEQWAFLPDGQRSAAHKHNTTSHSSALGFLPRRPGLNHSDQATTFLYSSCSSPMHDGAGPVAGRGRPVLLLPMPREPMPLAGFPADMIQRHRHRHRHQATQRAMHQQKQKSFACLHAPATDMIQSWYSECMATCHSTQISAVAFALNIFLFCFWEASNIGGHRSPKE